MAEFSYLTVKGRTSGIYKEKGSKFISFAFPINSESEAKDRLNELRKTYHDASHHCFAWIIGADKSQERASDDGEPSHSAGDPILGQIKSRKLTHVMVVVVRYFGGTKLGVGGLIAAYRAAAHDALTKAEVIEVEVTQDLVIKYDYDQTPEVMRLVKTFDLTILQQEFQIRCRLNAKIKLKHKEKFESHIRLLKATGTRIEIEL